MTDPVVSSARVRARVERALARVELRAGASFAEVVRAVEGAVGVALTVVAETDTASWGTLTGFLAYFPDRNEGTIHVRAADARVYREFAASHELGHLLDGAHCGRGDGDAVSSPAEVEAELVAERIAHDIARRMYAGPRVAELSW